LLPKWLILSQLRTLRASKMLLDIVGWAELFRIRAVEAS
jgi:hypothetical protein